MKKSIEPAVRPAHEKKPLKPSPQKPNLKKNQSQNETVEEEENKISSASIPQRDPEHEDRKQLLRPQLEENKRTYTGDPW